MRDCERLRAFTSTSRIVWSRICRISWDFRDDGAPLSQERSFERLTSVARENMRDCERLTSVARENMRDCERLRAFTSTSRIVWSRICRISWDFRDDGAPLSQERSFERLTSVARENMRDCKRLRAFTSVSRIVWSRICRIFWDFRDDGAPLTQERSFERLTSVHERCTREHERLRAFTSVHERQ